jgi:pimeloyl-ACP methyl ester carboxylesterase
VDAARIALFGSSFSGGHVIDVAARDAQIAAVVSQAPFADGLVQLRVSPPKVAVRATVDALLDAGGALLGRPPRTIPAVGPPGSYAVMTAPEAEPGFAAITGEDSRWRNAVGARVMLQVGTFRPIASAAKVACPLLVCVCDADATTPPDPAARMAERAPRGEVVRYPIGHFDIYTGAAFERAVADQLAFLRRALLPAAAPEPVAAARG